MFVRILERMGFRKSDDDNYWFKDYGNNVVLKVMSAGSSEIEIELNMPIPTDVNPSSLDKPEDIIDLIVNSPTNKNLLLSLLRAINDMMNLRLVINMSN
ncbi:hypothetical protein VMUT_0749 [Vulcanisaeta moutnovskia 768-28]|uniref:Uncharacterized protein n=1 Tax=Vulcanisaeta moutnovskia (strain 768-28) TaxID=985053 RepID=F0QW36_VULM7|nr:hypothetical protein [Vulcanisaeta moutnovskia]ADY00960.1 hypothetical protein VMUT_0749 [Vulcanisaeta moutnovskia 768-28]